MTDPLTEEEKNPKKYEYDISGLRFEGADYSEAYKKFLTYFIENKFTDGMSVAPPTPEAVKEMLTGTIREPDEVIPGEMTPTHGIVTIEKIAINAVMAGAKPVFACYHYSCRNALRPRFRRVSPSMHRHFLTIAYRGGRPDCKEIGMNCKTGYLGPGTRANSTIGRAVSLCAINLGWLDFDIDAGMTGQPSRYCNLTFCENEEDSPWEPFHVSMGYSAEDSTVTIGDHARRRLLVAEITHMPSGSVWTYGLQKDLDRIAERAQGTLGQRSNLYITSTLSASTTTWARRIGSVTARMH